MKFHPREYFKKYIRLLQLENYHLRRYAHILWQQKGKQVSSPIYWTLKLIIVAITAALGMILLQLVGFYLLFLLAKVVGLVFFSIATLFWLAITILSWALLLLAASALLSPLDALIKFRIIRKARKKIQNRKDLVIVAITGSYGKTTMKEVVSQFVAEKYQILKTPENINTPLGVARLILEKLTTDVELLIVEMGAFYKHDIRNLCRLTPPDISILTGINESHLERFGTLANTIQTKFEIVTFTRDNALIVLNHDDENILGNYKKFILGKKVALYGKNKNKNISYEIQNIEFSKDRMGMTFDLKGKNSYRFQLNLLGEYMPATVMGAVTVAEQLQIPVAAVQSAARLLKPLPHRLQPIKTDQDMIIIDDSYNGNPQGVKEAVKTLARFKERRKICISPGLVEMGTKTAEIHRAIGRDLAKVADMVLLVRNSVTKYIAEGLEEGKFPQNNLLWFNQREQAHQAIKGIIRRGDVLLFQNDWPENYY